MFTAEQLNCKHVFLTALLLRVADARTFLLVFLGSGCFEALVLIDLDNAKEAPQTLCFKTSFHPKHFFIRSKPRHNLSQAFEAFSQVLSTSPNTYRLTVA